MSDKEQVNNQRELNKSKKEQINIDQKIQDVNQRSLDISYSLVESLKETLGIQSKYSQNEKDILRVNKEVNKFYDLTPLRITLNFNKSSFINYFLNLINFKAS